MFYLSTQTDPTNGHNMFTHLTRPFTGEHLTHEVPNINLNAFNLTPGLTFVTDEEQSPESPAGFAVWIVMSVARAMHNERVFIWARRGDIITEGPGDSVPNRSFDFDYCTPVAVIGNVLNYMDPDDNDWGN